MVERLKLNGKEKLSFWFRDDPVYSWLIQLTTCEKRANETNIKWIRILKVKCRAIKQAYKPHKAYKLTNCTINEVVLIRESRQRHPTTPIPLSCYNHAQRHTLQAHTDSQLSWPLNLQAHAPYMIEANRERRPPSPLIYSPTPPSLIPTKNDCHSWRGCPK